MRHITRLVVLSLAACVAILVSAPATANWTASGTFLYENRIQDSTGFTGEVVQNPIRFADVEVLDAKNNKVLARGATSASGSFSISVTDSSTRNIYVRALSSTTQTSGLQCKVMTLRSNVYAMRTATLNNHKPNVNVNWGNLLAVINNGGEVFNMLDLQIYGANFVKALRGSWPGMHQIKWELNGGNTGAAWTSGCSTTMRDYAAYDDTVVLHEWSHCMMYLYSNNDSPGGTHALADCGEDLRLAFDEGRASYLGNSVRRYWGMANSNVYVRTTGTLGTGGVENWYDLETETQYACDGSTSEVAVSRALWDITDGPASADMTPGVDDDPPDALALPDLDVWQVNVSSFLKNASQITHETFWDGWFDASVANGYLTDMRVLHDAFSMEYEPDAYEPNGTTAEAPEIFSNGPPIHLTYFSDPDGDGKGQADTDLFRLTAANGVAYTVRTLNLLSDANTNLEIVDTDGTSVLASNNDCPGLTDGSSCLTWTAPRSDTFYIRSKHASDVGIYGSYDLEVTNP